MEESMSLRDVTICITSFLRPGYFTKCLESIKVSLPECSLVVVDDSSTDARLNATGFDPELGTTSRFIYLKFDSGLTVKRNTGVKATKTPYWFCGSDDVDFSTRGFKEHLTAATELLDSHPEIDLVGGRVDSRPYESNLEHDTTANVIREHRLVPDGSPYQRCDLVVNAFLARTSTLLEVPWDEDVVPIGGEHGQFFWHMKKAGKVTVWLPGMNLNTLQLGQGSNVQDPRYRQFRMRAFSHGHTTMLKKEGINDWVGA
jgi:hypothetical protein